MYEVNGWTSVVTSAAVLLLSDYNATRRKGWEAGPGRPKDSNRSRSPTDEIHRQIGMRQSLDPVFLRFSAAS